VHQFGYQQELVQKRTGQLDPDTEGTTNI